MNLLILEQQLKDAGVNFISTTKVPNIIIHSDDENDSDEYREQNDLGESKSDEEEGDGRLFQLFIMF